MSRNLTTEIFVIKANIKHNNFYIYIKTKYVKSDEKVIITCPIHGDFEMTPNAHLNGSGCPKCALERLSQPKLTYDDFVKRARFVHGDIYGYHLFNKLEGVKKKVPIWCPEHGVFWQTPDSHLSGKHCPKCKYKKYKIEFVNKANKVHNCFYIYDKYNYIDSKTKGIITCPIHGDFEMTPNAHLAGHGCPLCHKRITNLQEFIIEAVKIHGDKYDYSHANFVNMETKMKIWCKKCKRFFWQDPYHHLQRQQGCPYCDESHGEKNIVQYLEKHNINFEREKRFKDCRDKKPLPFDFYIPSLNTCIEYDGQQHFKPVDIWGKESGFNKLKKRDKIKTDYCLKNHIRIIRIKYTEPIEDILDLYNLK